MSSRSVRSRVLPAGVEIAQLEAGHRHVVNLAQVVVESHHLEPLGLGRHHAPGRQVVERRAPQHRLLATRIHRDVAADAAGLGRGRIHREHEASALGRIRHALGHDTGLGPDRGHRVIDARQDDQLDLGHRFELLGVDHRAAPGQRNRTTGVAGAAAARDDRQAQLDTALHQRRHLGLGIGRQHDERIFHAPIGCIGHMRDARQRVELDVVARGHPAQRAAGLATQLGHLVELIGETLHRAFGEGQQLRDVAAVLDPSRGHPLLHFGQAVVQGIDQQPAAARVVQQIILQVRVALHHPDVAQHLVQHACRTPGLALAAQPTEQFPGAGPEQSQHDLAVGKRGVVVRNLAQAGVPELGGRRGNQLGEGRGCVHEWGLARTAGTAKLRSDAAGPSIVAQGKPP